MPTDGSSATCNMTMSMSGAARARMRDREKPTYHYYNDMGGAQGNCSWGIGTLEHLGPCSTAEMEKVVSPTQAEAVFAANVSVAERAVRKNVTSQSLSQAQFDALVSFTFNVGERGARDTYDLIEDGDFQGAARNMSSITTVKVKTEHGWKRIVARGLVIRRAEESAPFRMPNP